MVHQMMKQQEHEAELKVKDKQFQQMEERLRAMETQHNNKQKMIINKEKTVLLHQMKKWTLKKELNIITRKRTMEPPACLNDIPKQGQKRGRWDKRKKLPKDQNKGCIDT